MTPTEAVIHSLNMLLERHKDDIAQANQVNIGLNPKFGHGDDIWIRTEKIHVVAEVTITGSERTENMPLGTRRMKLDAKVRKLVDRSGVTHKYLIVPANCAASYGQRKGLEDVEVLFLSSG